LEIASMAVDGEACCSRIDAYSLEKKCVGLIVLRRLRDWRGLLVTGFWPSLSRDNLWYSRVVARHTQE
jgi:hypothetical protein